MRKLIKKSLACCLALALLLSAAVTSLATVSETAQAAVEVSSFTVNAEKTTATAVVDITSTDGIAAIFLNATSDFGALTAVDLTNAGNTSDEFGTNADGFQAIVAGEDYDLEKGNIILLGQSTSVAVKSATITLTFTAAEAVADGSYTVTVAPAADLATADWNEVAATFATASATVEVATEPEVPELGTLTVLDTTTTTGFASRVEFGYNIYMEYSGDTSAIIERGYIALDSTKHDGESAITHETPGIIKAALSGYGTFVGATIYDIPVKNFNVDYYFIPYVYDGTNYIYGDQLAMSYADYLVTRTNGSAAVNIRARAYLDMLFALTGEALYDGAGLAALPEAGVTYTKTSDGKDYSNPGDVVLSATVGTTGFASRVEFGINFTKLAYTGDTANVTERGYIALDSSKYDGKSAITHETAGVINAALNGWGTSIAATIYDIPFKNFYTDYIFVPYILDNGEYVYGEYVEMNYADYFIDRINGARSNASQQQTVQKCVTYLNAYEALTGTSIHTVG